MKPKAPRIAPSIWEQYKDEIVALYQKGTLEKTMNTMEERHGFKATRNQYTAKFESWGLKKYANATMWTYVHQTTKKRKLEGKDSIWEVRGRKRSRSSTEKEISRHVTYTSQVQLLEDIPTPEGIQVFTPCTESLPVALRYVYTSNLPWFEFQKDVRMMMAQVVGNGVPGLGPGFLQNYHSATEITVGGTMNSTLLHECWDMINPNARPNNDLSDLDFRDLDLGRQRPLALYFPSSDADELSLSTFDSNEMTHGSNALHAFIAYFVYVTNNNLLNSYQVEQRLELISRNFEPTFLRFLLGLNSVSISIFKRKIFSSVVKFGNASLAKTIIDSGIDVSKYCQTYRKPFALRDDCMSIAVSNGDQKMVELLCKEGFPAQIKSWYRRKLPWHLGGLDILRTLLLFGADPECFVVDMECGFPLVDAARSGNLEAVDMLLKAGAKANQYSSNHYGTALDEAVYSENLEIVELLIDRGADVNFPYRTPTRSATVTKGIPENTPLEIAVGRNNTSLAQLLVDRGADVDACVPIPNEGLPLHFDCPLRSAVKNQNAAIATVLLYKGANVDCRRHSGNCDTPLQMAANCNYPEMVTFLLLHGADVNAAPGTSFGRTATQAAAENGNLEIIRMLLETGADINAPPGHNYGLTALQAAIKNGHPLMAGALYAAGADLNALPGYSGGFTATQAAARVGDLNMLRSLIDWGADINGPTAKKDGLTVMEAATLSENLPILELLVEHGVKINAPSSDNNVSRCLAIAASKQWLDGVVYLLDIGADLDGYWRSEYTYEKFNALGWSVYLEDITMLNLLLDNGADVYSPVSDDYDSNGICALSLGLTWSSSFETICSLISRYEELERVCEKEYILAYALNDKTKDSQIFRIILGAMNGLPKDVYDDQIQEAWNVINMGDYETFETQELAEELMELLLDSGVDINSRDDETRTALHRALDTSQTHTFKYLVEKGAEINTPAAGDIGTPLQTAIRNGVFEIVSLLLEKGAEINTPAVGDIGTPLQEAIRYTEFEIVSLLLERGADINAAPAEIRGTTALQAASINGLTGLVIDLLRRGASVSEPAAFKFGRTAINGAAERGRHDMLQLLLNHYDGDEDLRDVCDEAATYAEKECHFEIAEWLRQYSIV